MVRRLSQGAGRPSRKGREELECAPRGLGQVRRTSRRIGWCQKALLEGREGYGVPFRWLGVWKPSQKGQEESRVPSRGQEWLQGTLEGRKGSRGPPGVLGGVRKPFWRAGIGCEGRERSGTPPRGQEGSGGPTGWLKGDGSPSWRPRRGRESPKKGRKEWEALQESWEGLGGPGEVKSPSRKTGMGW